MTNDLGVRIDPRDNTRRHAGRSPAIFGVVAFFALAAVDPTVGGESTAPVELSGARIRVWREGSAQFALIEGRASALRGLDGVRGDRIAARIDPEANGSLRVALIADGSATRSERPGKAEPRLHSILIAAAGAGVRFRDDDQPGPVPIGPKVDHPLIRLLTTPTTSASPVAVAAPRVSLGGPTELERDDVGVSPAQVLDGIDFKATDEPPVAAPPAVIDDAPPDIPTPLESKPEAATEILSRPAGAPVIPPPSRIDEAPPEILPAPLGDEAPEGLDAEDVGPRLEPPVNPPGSPPLRMTPGPGSVVMPPAPRTPGTQRVIKVLPRSGGSRVHGEVLGVAPDGTRTIIYQGGINLISRGDQKAGTVDLSADQVVVWIKPKPGGAAGGGPKVTADRDIQLDGDQPVEVYLEGNVVFRQDEGKLDGPGDVRNVRAKHGFFDFQTERFVMLDAEFDVYAQGFLAPVRVRGERIQQFRETRPNPRGGFTLGDKIVRADRSTTTGSRFANPGYRFNSRTIDLSQVPGEPEGPEDAPDPVWQIDARRNAFFLGKVPFLYWPRFVAKADDLDPPLNSFQVRTNRVFGQQALSDWNGFKLFGLNRPKSIGRWNVDIDYLSRRGFALGSELTWSGKEFIPEVAGEFYGYFDVWGLNDGATDILGPGPAIITNNLPAQLRVPPLDRLNVPAFQDFRGRVLFRHMQSLLPTNDDSADDFRLQVEAGASSDRNFLEEYYKSVFDSGLDQSNLAYLIRQNGSTVWSALIEGNAMDWQTESQWLPKLDYYRFGDAPLKGLLTYYGNTGVDYANTHTATEVNNPNLFALPGGGRAFLPYDPVSNTTGVFRAGRAYSSHELDFPIDLGVVKFTPYAQGQLVGWSNQLSGDAEGRAWGALGGRLSVTAWRTFPDVESEWFNLHGLAHKVNLFADGRSAHSSLGLNQVGVQDDLDDNTYEYVRRYFMLNSYPSGILPLQLDPRLLALRSGLSPITQTPDAQDRLDTVRLGLFQRWQTKRGPEGDRRVADVATLNLSTTYFPNATRDNFGQSLGQNQFDFRWNISDRTAVTSTGWFETWDITGKPAAGVDNSTSGINLFTLGLLIQRPPRGQITLGYSFIDAGPLQTSAASAAFSYYMSPKWYSSMSFSYDFANTILLGTSFGVTRIGADYLTTVGLWVDPQRENYTFAFEIAPRLSPNLRLGSGSVLNRFNPRAAPVE